LAGKLVIALNPIAFGLKVLALIEEVRSYRFIARELNLSKNTVLGIAQRHREQI